MSCERNAHFLNAPFAYHPKKVSVKRSLQALAAKTSERKIRVLIPKWRFLCICIQSGIITENGSSRRKWKNKKSSPRTSFLNSERESRFCRMAD
ncbi:hypothetical protein CDAR_591041 [Caerostris darwini]|uniref:Uncharacterized protein n=1 Tax=Caerostris darwini TaxID=1538125 RepID=A0AAV4RQK6_9ARAC|nr:hypothetical protein CDAR_591041 [Caerostris darwini]